MKKRAGKIKTHESKANGNVAEVMKRVNDINLTALCDIDESALYVQKSTHLGENKVNIDLSTYHL